MDRIEISLLGPLQVAVNGRTVTDFRTESERAVLVYLAMHSDTACRRDALAALLWPDRPDAAAFRNLRVTLTPFHGLYGVIVFFVWHGRFRFGSHGFIAVIE